MYLALIQSWSIQNHWTSLLNWIDRLWVDLITNTFIIKSADLKLWFQWLGILDIYKFRAKKRLLFPFTGFSHLMVPFYRLECRKGGWPPSCPTCQTACTPQGWMQMGLKFPCVRTLSAGVEIPTVRHMRSSNFLVQCSFLCQIRRQFAKS
jgi:hypothetical protein